MHEFLLGRFHFPDNYIIINNNVLMELFVNFYL